MTSLGVCANAVLAITRPHSAAIVEVDFIMYS